VRKTGLGRGLSEKIQSCMDIGSHKIKGHSLYQALQSRMGKKLCCFQPPDGCRGRVGQGFGGVWKGKQGGEER